MRLLTELPYVEDSSRIFESLAHRPWAVYLDSGRPYCQTGRFDLLAADPYVTIVTRGEKTLIDRRDGTTQSSRDPFELVRELLGQPLLNDTGLPFCGGAIGWFGYDLGRRIESLPSIADDAEALPEMAIGLYDWAVVVDHRLGRTHLVGQGRDPLTRQRWLSLVQQLGRPARPRRAQPFTVMGEVRSNMSRDAYGRAFDRIKQYIRDGDCYQVNLAQRFSVPAQGSGWQAYQRLRLINPAPFAGFINTPFGQALSSSPERLLRVDRGKVETKPIKGTRPRGGTPEGDSALARELAESRKDRAENLMIVDLLRNDISRACRAGSVRVPKLFDIESFATVHHLVSTVTGELAEGKDALDLLRACFPGGSITGAPKIRAMEIIEELEPHRRGLYCGSIAYIGFDGNMDSNITIRTLVYNQGEMRCWAGGGIVHDSDVDEEYQETLDKAAAMLRLLQAEDLAGVGG